MRTKGQVQMSNISKGYGFIKTLDTNEVVFVRFTEIQGDTKKDTPLARGEIVEFDIEQAQAGLQAKNVARTFFKGNVAAYQNDKGYGFIQYGDKSIYVHFTSILGSGYKTLKQGDIVEFTEGRNDRGEIALNVSVIQSDSDSSSEDIISSNSEVTQKIESSQISEDDRKSYPEQDQILHKSYYVQSFGIEGFKAFGEAVSLPIRPITMLAGLNSQGKSSIIHALLLLKQTLIAEKRVGSRLALDWSGTFFNVDKFAEMIYDKDSKGKFTFSFNVPLQSVPQYQKPEHLEAILPADSEDFIIKADFTFSLVSVFDKEIVSLSISLAVLEKNKTLYEMNINEFRYDNEFAIVKVKSGDSGKELDFRDVIHFSYFLPVWEEMKYPSPSSDINEDEKKWLEDEKERFRFYIIYRDLFAPAIEAIERELLHNLKYLGPLREKPQRKYSKRQLPIDDIGIMGENAILLLEKNWEEDVEFVSLPEDKNKVVSWKDISASVKKMKLSQAINESLRWLDMQELQVKATSESVRADFSTLSQKETWVTIADVGFGISQILPVLTMGLLSDKDSIIIFEQPEIHLHPKAQARLAELFICFASIGKRIIIETHSDHLINRMRRIIAEDLSNELKDEVRIIFVQQCDDGKGAMLEELQVDKDGRIKNWPPGFLDNTAEESKAIVKASIVKRQQTRR